MAGAGDKEVVLIFFRKLHQKLDLIRYELAEIKRQEDKIMALEAEVDALVTKFTQVVTDVVAGMKTLQDELTTALANADTPAVEDGLTKLGAMADTLEEIWTRYNPYDQHGVTNDMTKDQLNDLIEYLRTL